MREIDNHKGGITVCGAYWCRALLINIHFFCGYSKESIIFAIENYTTRCL
nr:MAG TPA: hypothetical protein [Caudoviricetes sp.]